MKRTAFVVGVAMWSIAGCDLPELHERQDAGAPTDDGGGPANMATPDLSEAAAAADLGGGADLSGSDDGQIPPGAPLGSCDPRAWVASASMSHPVNPPSYAIDSLQPTRWTTGAPQSVGQYLQIDFGGFVMIDRIAIDHTLGMDGKDDYPRSLDVLVSYDGADYSRKLRSATYTADPGVVSLDFPAHAARYLRLQLSESATVPWWTIHELTVGCQTPGTTNDGGIGMGPDAGDPTGPSNPNRANWTATASGSAGGDVVANAFDGVATTRWASGKAPQYGDEWFRLDLGQAVSISQVWLTATNGDHPSAWELDLSTDDASYTAVARGLGADVTKMAFPTQAARYVRIRQIGSGYDHWWSINELTVFQ
jgi:glucosylceramidase